MGVKKYLPLLSLTIVFIFSAVLSNSPEQPTIDKPYFVYALVIFAMIYSILLLVPKLKKPLEYYGLFIFGMVLFLGILNLLTAKFALLPVLYFRSFDSVIAVFFKDYSLLEKCLIYSLRLLFFGYLFGASLGIITGILVGFSKAANYWISPLIRVLGPTPSIVWIPIALIIFPSAVSASVFLIGFSVWFPTVIMASNGIFNIRQIYFDVGETLGATGIKKIIYIGIPSSMPYIFLGMFNGMCASFITLITAEMVGARYGIGWYINMNREMLSFSNVYAGILIIIILFSMFITILFGLRNKVLVWQKGYIKW